MDEKKAQREARARANWTPPGPVPPGDPDLVLQPHETLDAFCGHWRILQRRDGHRYSTDDLLAAWYACECVPAPKKVLDLGCGIGSVGMLVAWRYPEIHLSGIEAQSQSLALFRRSLRYNGVTGAELFEGDLRHLKLQERFDLVTASPPYWDTRAGILSQDSQKSHCRFERRGDVQDYLVSARHHLCEGGTMAMVFDGRQIERLEALIQNEGFAIIRKRMVISREGDAPLLVLLALKRQSETQEASQTEPPLLLRNREGLRSPDFRQLRALMGFPPGPR